MGLCLREMRDQGVVRGARECGTGSDEVGEPVVKSLIDSEYSHS